MNIAMEILSVSKSYDTFRLEDVSLAIPAGTILGLIGQNGAGKTTLFNCILNLIRRDSGCVRLPGSGLDISSEGIRHLVGYVPERLAFYEWMTVAGVLRFTSKFYATWDCVRCRELLERYELDPGKRIRQLSLGMKKKLCLLLALAIRPRLLILDEPTSGLDPVMRFHLLNDLRRILDSGETLAILMSSHNLDEVERLVDRVAILKLGRMKCHESRQDLLAAWHRVQFRPPPGNDWIYEFGNALHFAGSDCAIIVTRQEPGFLTRRLTILGAGRIRVDRPSLQEIFLRVA